jgi:hypothetical protein
MSWEPELELETSTGVFSMFLLKYSVGRASYKLAQSVELTRFKESSNLDDK